MIHGEHLLSVDFTTYVSTFSRMYDFSSGETYSHIDPNNTADELENYISSELNNSSTNATEAPKETKEITVESDKIKTTEEVQYYKINDPDGYSNLRDAPKGEVIQKVLDSEKFEIIGEESSYKKVKLSSGIIGYIHKSRVIKL